MSDRKWRFYLNDMNQFAGNVLAYSDGLDQAAFETTGLNYDATVRNLELIGKAASNIPSAIREACISSPWRQIITTQIQLAGAIFEQPVETNVEA